MKTSEFIEKFNESSYFLKAVKYNNKICLMYEKTREYLLVGSYLEPLDADVAMEHEQLKLIMEYLNTPVKDREDEHKWVVPFGSDLATDHQNFWRKIYGEYSISSAFNSDWRESSAVQFTDSELKKLKKSQPSPIAQSIDLMKEPAPEVEQ